MRTPLGLAASPILNGPSSLLKLARRLDLDYLGIPPYLLGDEEMLKALLLVGSILLVARWMSRCP